MSVQPIEVRSGDQTTPPGTAPSVSPEAQPTAKLDKTPALFCDQCNYNLTGLSASNQDEKGKSCIRCPECGHLQPTDSPLKKPPSRLQQISKKYGPWILLIFFHVQMASIGAHYVMSWTVTVQQPNSSALFGIHIATVLFQSLALGICCNWSKSGRRLPWELCLLAGCTASGLYMAGAIVFMPMIAGWVPQGTDPYSLLMHGTFLGLLGVIFITTVAGASVAHRFNAFIIRRFAKLNPWLEKMTPWLEKQWARLCDWIRQRRAKVK